MNFKKDMTRKNWQSVLSFISAIFGIFWIFLMVILQIFNLVFPKMIAALCFVGLSLSLSGLILSRNARLIAQGYIRLRRVANIINLIILLFYLSIYFF